MIVAEKIELGLFDIDEKLFVWDCPDAEYKDRTENVKYEEELRKILSFLDDEEDYHNYLWNEELMNLLQSNAAEDYLKYKKFFAETKYVSGSIENELKYMDFMIDILNSSAFFRADKVDVSLYKQQDIEKLKDRIPELTQYDFLLINNLVDEINFLSNSLSTNQKIFDKLIEARKTLKNVNDEYDSEGKKCPFCNTIFADRNLLEKGFNEVDTLLKISLGENFTQIQIKKEALLRAISGIKEIIIKKIADYNGIGVSELLKEKTMLQNFFKDAGRVEKVEKLLLYINNSDFGNEFDEKQKAVEINQTLSRQVKIISNSNFEKNMKVYSYGNIEKKYEKYMDELHSIHNSGKLKARWKFIQSLVQKSENDEIQILRKQLFELVACKRRVTYLREKLVALNKEYEKIINEYKNMTLKKLRVPLLIYTGKILQDYQNGLGVFVNKDEMRFVSNGDAKHDILNTFSSGQLSGFVLAFLFAMNKQYIKKSDDDLGFILVDDPVQTMDDINISSLIEVLRNDFADKQIIISTHENDKENYILYKFFKYNKIGQSLNVKDEIYSV